MESKEQSPFGGFAAWWAGLSKNAKALLIVVGVLGVVVLGKAHCNEEAQRSTEVRQHEHSPDADGYDPVRVLLEQARAHKQAQESRFNALSPEEHYHEAEIAKSRGRYDEMDRHLDALVGTPLESKGRSYRELADRERGRQEIANRQRREREEEAARDELEQQRSLGPRINNPYVIGCVTREAYDNALELSAAGEDPRRTPGCRHLPQGTRVRIVQSGGILSGMVQVLVLDTVMRYWVAVEHVDLE